MSQTATRLGIFLRPLDSLFFRDARPFDAASRAVGGLPNPRTFAGAMRTAMLSHAGRYHRGWKVADGPEWITRARFRGPWLAKKPSANASVEDVYFAMPALLGAGKADDGSGPLYRSRPLPAEQIAGWSEPLRPLWCNDSNRPTDLKPATGYLTLTGLSRFLADESIDGRSRCRASQLFGTQQRTGIGIDADRLTTDDSQIYSLQLLVLHEGIGFYGEVVFDVESKPPISIEQVLPKQLPLGGEGKYVGVEMVPPLDWPNHKPRNGRALWLLVSPAFVRPKTAYPEVIAALANGQLQAAASGKAESYSGWDVLRGGPMPTRFAVPAGSVYFVKTEQDTTKQSLCGDAEDIAQGWGFFLQGVWNDER